MSTESKAKGRTVAEPGEPAAPACVMTFNACDADGCRRPREATSQPLPPWALTPCLWSLTSSCVTPPRCSSTLRLDPDTVAEQARGILEDVTIAAWKVGFLRQRRCVGIVAEILSDYPDAPRGLLAELVLARRRRPTGLPRCHARIGVTQPKSLSAAIRR
jgi:hydroxymethylpyrimidine/phosphomethylpyrimidine kinase